MRQACSRRRTRRRKTDEAAGAQLRRGLDACEVQLVEAVVAEAAEVVDLTDLLDASNPRLRRSRYTTEEPAAQRPKRRGWWSP